MSVGSPTAYLLWATLSCLFFGFMLFHLWCYDRFSCLRWNSGRQPGAFKRVMTYSYLASVPMLVVFSVAMTVLKFKEGFVFVPGENILPKPTELWSPDHRHWVLPLNFVFSSAWSLELVTHLEELTFWLFLLNQGPGKRDWFESGEFRIWYMGSMASILGMPLVALISRRQIETSQAWIFLVGSSAGTFTTLCFIFVLVRFPGFLRHVKTEGAEPDVVVRLATFYQLNLARVCFRFLFTVPLLAIALDGIQPPYTIIENPFWSDFLLMIGGIGCFVSSAITLLIFFPRSITKEAGYKAKNPSMSSKTPIPNQAFSPAVSPRHSLHPYHPHHQFFHNPQSPKSPGTAGPSPRTAMAAFRYPASSSDASSESTPEYDDDNPMSSPVDIPMPDIAARCARETIWVTQDPAPEGSIPYPYPEYAYTQQRRQRIVVSMPEEQTAQDTSSSTHVHPYVMNFTSPIDLLDPDDMLPRAI